ncbi:MAG: helix-turn-helix transcriptional regulator [Glaciecola sp.]|jgi:prophage regulatory protein|nr:AlpA family phage regulatory protein [Glaciecola sp.]
MTYNTELLRRPEVVTLTARSRSSLQLDEKAGLFCPPIAIGYRAVAYLRHEVQAVIQARIEGKTPDEIKQLVFELVNQRKQTA